MLLRKKRLYDLSGSAADKTIFSEARAQMQYELLCEEIFLHQQSSVRWVREDNANTRFFHTIIQNKCWLFHIYRIEDASSEWISKPAIVALFVVDYFEGLLARGAS